MKLDYLKIYERAARMVWERRILWLFGVLSLFGSCGSNNASLNSNYSSSSGSNSNLYVAQLERIWAQYAVLIIIVALLAILVGIVLMIIGYVARAGLIKMVSGFDSGAQPTAGEGFSEGSHYWLKLLGIDLTLFLPLLLMITIVVVIAVAAIALTVPGFASIGQGSAGAAAGAGAGTALCCVFGIVAVLIIVLIPVVIFLSVMQVLAHRACVLDDNGVFNSIRLAYRLVRTRFGDVALMWLLRVVIGIVISIVLLLVMLIAIGLPVAAMILNVCVGGILLIPGLLLVMFLVGVVEAFTSAAWTIAYRQMTGDEPQAPAVEEPQAPGAEGPPAPANAT